MTRLPPERLRAVLDYSPDTGLFYWRINTRNGKAHIGDVAGHVHSNGYRYIKIDGRAYRANRLAFLWMTGSEPGEVDHADTAKANDKWGNLRECTHSQNAANRGVSKSNSSGLKGVSWFKPTRKWHAQIKVMGKGKSLGLYDCPAAAHFAYVVRSHQSFGEYARAA